MRLYLGLVILLPGLAFGDCIPVTDPLRPANSVLPQSSTCSDNISLPGGLQLFTPRTAGNINAFDLSTLPANTVAMVPCSNCTLCWMCISTGTVAGQTACETNNRTTGCR